MITDNFRKKNQKFFVLEGLSATEILNGSTSIFYACFRIPLFISSSKLIILNSIVFFTGERVLYILHEELHMKKLFGKLVPHDSEPIYTAITTVIVGKGIILYKMCS